MLTKEHADFLRTIAQNECMIDNHMLPSGEQLEAIASSIENTVRIAASDAAKYKALQDIGKSAAESIAEMVAALECDYDRLAELRAAWQNETTDGTLDTALAGRAAWAAANPDDAEELAELETAAGDCESRDDAEQRIHEDPLSIELAGKWSLGSTPEADRAYILLGTGGPATRIVCELDENMEPHRAWVEAQDWGTPWTEYHGDAVSDDDLLTYCRCFYFGEG